MLDEDARGGTFEIESRAGPGTRLHWMARLAHSPSPFHSQDHP